MLLLLNEGLWGHSIANALMVAPMCKFSVSEIKNATEKAQVGVYEEWAQTTHKVDTGVGLNAVTHLAIHETRVLGYWGRCRDQSSNFLRWGRWDQSWPWKQRSH